MTYATAFLALWFVLGIIAPTKRGTHAKHNAFLIWKPKGPLNPDGSNTEFAHRQEKGEYRLHKLIGISAGAAFVYLCAGLMQPTLLVTATFVVTVMVDGFGRKLNFIDYAGHGAEIIAAEKAGAIGYRAEEMARMATNRDKQGQDIPALLAKWNWLARIVYRLSF